MTIDFVEIFKSIPPELATVLTAMTPIGELRAALPIALTAYEMPFWKAYLLSVAGNIIIVAILLWFLEPVSNFLRKHLKFMDKFFTWLFDRTQKKHSEKFERWGAIALITFVAIPLPVTGGWTGSAAAFVFNIPPKKALPIISVGIAIAGVIVGIITEGFGILF